jgi:hypothetical protein
VLAVFSTGFAAGKVLAGVSCLSKRVCSGKVLAGVSCLSNRVWQGFAVDVPIACRPCARLNCGGVVTAFTRATKHYVGIWRHH